MRWMAVLPVVSSLVVVGCGGAEPVPCVPGPVASAPLPVATAPMPPSSAPPVVASAAPEPAFVAAAPLDEKAVADATGVDKPEKTPEGAMRVTWPRKDIEVAVDGWKVPPFMGLTSWAGFAPGKKGVADVMVMGDLVLFEDEVNPVMTKLLAAGVEVTALHNHFFFSQPPVFFMHIGGEGTVAGLGGGLKAAMDEIAAIRKKSKKPASTFGDPKMPAKSTLDAAKLDAALSTKGAAKDGMYKATWGRDVNAACGCPVGKSLGVNTWAGFAGSDDVAVVDGDFAVLEKELQPVLKSLRAEGIEVVAIHHHMSGEEPRVLFIHYWGRGKAMDLAAKVKKTLDLTAWSGKSKST